jgi:hypothetical protein
MADRHDGDDERAERSAKRALPVFNGKATSFPIWKARVRAWLSAESPPLLYVIEESDGTDGGAASATGASTSASAATAPGGNKKKTGERQLERDRLKVYNALISALDDTHVGMVVTEVEEGDAIGAWRILVRKYERNTAASRNQLRRELHTLKMGAKESVDEYKARAMYVVTRLKAAKEGVSDGEILYCLMEGLPVVYAMVRQALEVQDVIDLEEACVHLREVEDKVRRERELKEAASTASGSGRNSRETGSSTTASRGYGSSRETAEEEQLSRVWVERETRRPAWRRPAMRCRVCNRVGHLMFDCPKRCHDGCFRCGGDHEVRDCEQDFVQSGDSEREDGSFDGQGRRLERRPPSRPGTPVPGERRV